MIPPAQRRPPRPCGCARRADACRAVAVCILARCNAHAAAARRKPAAAMGAIIFSAPCWLPVSARVVRDAYWMDPGNNDCQPRWVWRTRAGAVWTLPARSPAPDVSAGVSTPLPRGSRTRPSTSLPVALPPSCTVPPLKVACAELSMSWDSPAVVAPTPILAMHSAQPIIQWVECMQTPLRGARPPNAKWSQKHFGGASAARKPGWYGEVACCLFRHARIAA